MCIYIYTYWYIYICIITCVYIIYLPWSRYNIWYSCLTETLAFDPLGWSAWCDTETLEAPWNIFSKPQKWWFNGGLMGSNGDLMVVLWWSNGDLMVVLWWFNGNYLGFPWDVMLVGGKTTPLKNMKVSWDDDIPNIWKKNMFQTTNQPM